MRPEVSHVVDAIRRRYAEPLSLTDLANEVCLSRFHLARLFGDETGLPPGHYLTAVRMEQARGRLLQTDDGIADISFGTGYASIGTFTTRFSKMNGVPPGQFRRLTHLGEDSRVFAAGFTHETIAYGTITGRVIRRDGLTDEPLYIAAFPGPKQPDRTARCRRIAHCNAYWQLPHVPMGEWSVQVISRSDRGSGIAIATSDPVKVAPGSATTVLLALDAPHRLPLHFRCRESAQRLPEVFGS